MTKAAVGQPRRRVAGFMLFELLAALILLTAFALIAGRLFTWTMRIIREAPEVQQDMERLDTMLDVLRQDVWSAERIEVRDPSTVRLHLPGGAAITWRTEDKSVIRETGQSGGQGDDDQIDTQSWSDLRATPRFERPAPAALVVRLTDSRGRASGELWMTSQVLSR